MFIIYHTNRLDLIVSFIMKKLLIKGYSNNNSMNSYVITKEKNMLQWIQNELKTKFRKDINLNFLSIKEYISKNFFKEIFVENLDVFSELELTWKLFSILSNKKFLNRFYLVKKFLEKDFYYKKCFFLSKSMSSLYQKNLFFCPEWMKELYYKNDNLVFFELWQIELWNFLIKKKYRFDLYQNFDINFFFQWVVKKLKSFLEDIEIPKEIFFIGLSVFPPILLFILKKISQYSNIHIIFFNPSKVYWQEINENNYGSLKLNYQKYPNFSESDQEFFYLQKEKISDKEINDKKEIGNPILISLGNQGRITLHTLTKLENSIEIDAFFDFSKKTLLSKIQRDILFFRDSSFNIYKDKFIHTISEKDYSFSVHMCYNIRREVEVLYENILKIFSEDLTLRPSDVLVMSPNIDAYAPYIKSIFRDVSTQYIFPFFIYNRKIINIYPILSVFFSLLDIFLIDCGFKEILSFLEHQEIASNFFIQKKEILILYELASEIETYFSINSKFLENIANNPNHKVWIFYKSFLFGKRKFSTKKNESIGKCYEQFNFKEFKMDNFHLIDNLRDFLKKFFYWKKKISRLYSLENWVVILHKFTKDLFFSCKKTKEAFFF